MPNIITVTHEVSDEFLRDIMTNTIESGSIWYWARARHVMRDKGLNVLSFQVAEVEDIDPDPDDDEWHTVTKDTILDGIQKVLAEGRVNEDIIASIRRAVADDDADIDADGCDVIIQHALLGELVYG